MLIGVGQNDNVRTTKGRKTSPDLLKSEESDDGSEENNTDDFSEPVSAIHKGICGRECQNCEQHGRCWLHPDFMERTLSLEYCLLPACLNLFLAGMQDAMSICY